MSARALLLAIGLVAGAAGEARAAPAWRLDGAATPKALAPGQRVTVRVAVTNLSRETWSEGQQDHLSYHWEDPAGAILERDGARTRLPFAVGPGETVALAATLAAPASAGRYVLRWALVRENAFWYDPPVGGGDAVAVDVGPAPGTWSIEPMEAPAEVAAGARATARVRLCNTGANAWRAELGDALGYHWLGAEGQRLEGVRTALPAAVEPGGCVVLPAELRAPALPGPYTLVWQPVREGVAWYGPGAGEAAAAVRVGAPRDAFAALSLSLPPLQAGLPALGQLTLENRGEDTWLPGHALKVSYVWTGPEGHVLEGIRTELAEAVEPGEVVELELRVRPPDAPGAHVLAPRLVREGEGWIAPERELAAAAVIGPPALAWQVVEAAWPARLAATGTDAFAVTVRNTGAEPWSPAAGDRLSYRWRTEDGAPLQHEGMRTELPHPVAPGETATVQVRVAGPPRAGSYTLALAMVREQVRWFPPPTGGPSEHVLKVTLRAAWWQSALVLVTLVMVLAARRRRPQPGSWRWAALELVPALWLWAAMASLGATFHELAAIELWQGGRAAAIGAAAVPGLIVLLAPGRLRPWLAFLLALGTAVLLLADLLYMHVLGAIVPVQALAGAHLVGDIGASVKALLRPEYAWLAAAPLAGLILAGAWPRARGPERASARARRRATLAGLLTMSLASLPIAVSLGGAMRSGLGSRVFSEQHNAGRFGVLGAHLFDVVRTLAGAVGQRALTAEEQAEIAAFFAAREPSRAPGFGAARGANLLVIQAEALQGWTIGASVAGQEITPFLNRLRRRALYYAAVVDITGQGMTSDAEYAILNSQYPLGQGAVAFLRAGNRFETVAHALQAAGYATLSAHPFKRGFWNRATLHPRYGFERSLFDRELGPGPTIGWGLADEAFFARMLPELAAAPKPFFAFLVTLSLHHPYDEFPPGLRRLQLGPLEGTNLGNYLHGIHHLDAALAELFAGLEAAGLADSTAVAIYGDHDARLGVTPEIAALAGEPAGSPSLPLRLERVPGFLVLPKGQVLGEVDAVGSHVDLAPTWLHYLGVPAPPAFVGRPLVPARAGPGVAALPDGSAVADDRLFAVAGRDIPPGGACFTAAGARTEREACADLVQRARRALAVSRAIADHDLARALPSRTEPGP
ncbi:sulfatase-like hydrolase/transferase [Nannocystis bainbridge]|uniref:Sulfatase-like hydrolase/transferase n=1 Tax=Nannocystis bainbridge TaxID=2995303 RepID=A0ABT5DZC5_9BACT|nr:sulfatase-like hydrolase/transferase [Nannocystis bainbridge]MDC0717797.1 sulfatase-like hydrolase/transferase [Nannocystis bainbridge]